MPLAATYRRVDLKALARYQIILLGEQRHIGVNNLPKVLALQCSGRELNQRPPDHESNTLATTPPSHLMKSALLLLLILKARKNETYCSARQIMLFAVTVLWLCNLAHSLMGCEISKCCL